MIEAVRRGGANGIYHAMSEDDVQAIMRHPFTMIASDGRLVRRAQHGSPYGGFSAAAYKR